MIRLLPKIHPMLIVSTRQNLPIIWIVNFLVDLAAVVLPNALFRLFFPMSLVFLFRLFVVRLAGRVLFSGLLRDGIQD